MAWEPHPCHARRTRNVRGTRILGRRAAAGWHAVSSVTGGLHCLPQGPLHIQQRATGVVTERSVSLGDLCETSNRLVGRRRCGLAAHPGPSTQLIRGRRSTACRCASAMLSARCGVALSLCGAIALAGRPEREECASAKHRHNLPATVGTVTARERRTNALSLLATHLCGHGWEPHTSGLRFPAPCHVPSRGPGLAEITTSRCHVDDLRECSL